MALAYIVRARTDLPAGAVQITDLLPNSSQRLPSREPAGQSGYLPPLYQDDQIVGNVAANVTTAKLQGLAAWAVDTLDVAGTGNGLTAANADDIADDIFAAAQAALAAMSNLDTAAVNTAIQLTAAASGIGLGTSVGTLLEVIRILAGEVYSVPAGTTVNGGAAFKASADGSFSDSASAARGYRKIYSTGALQISCGEGDLYNFGLSSFSYVVSGTAVDQGAVAVFQADGTLLNG